MIETITLIYYIATYISLFASIFFLLTWLENYEEKRPEPKEWPYVTMAIPAYNEEKHIARAIESLLAQDYPKDKLQIIVVENNHSTDKTYEIAKQYESKGVEVYSIPKGGKASALNFALTKAKGEFFGCLDADSVAAPDLLKKTIPLFSSEEVVSVTPALKVLQPKTFLGKIQEVEYLVGIFLRKVFDFLNSIHVTPGPGSIFRKSFLEKEPLDESNITEDIEIALRAQKAKLKIKNTMDAVVYAENPETLKALTKQRIRWYLGFLENLTKYKELFNPKKYGTLSLILLLSVTSIAFCIILCLFSFLVLGKNLFTNLILLKAIGLQTYIQNVLSNFSFSANIGPGTVLAIPILVCSLGMLFVAEGCSNEKNKIKLSYILYLLFYIFLFTLWWLFVIYYKLFAKEMYFGGVKWDNSIFRRKHASL